MKNWDYEEVTREARRRIKQLMDASIGKPDDEAQRLRNMAKGIYILWDGLTLGWRTDGAAMEMQQLLGPYLLLWRTELGLSADD